MGGSLRQRLALWRKKADYSRAIFLSRFDRPIDVAATVLDFASGAASLACLVCLAVFVGYDLNPADRLYVSRMLRVCQLVFAVALAYRFIFRFRAQIRQSRIIQWMVDAALLMTIVAWAWPQSQLPMLSWMWHRRFFLLVMGAYSVVNLSYSISKIPNRRTNPSLLMGASFLIFIIAGSFLLMLPKCTHDGISYFDALFVSSSAVCITGLTPVDIPSTFTPLGLGVLSLLVQLGSLGVITFTSFFAIFYTGNTSIYNQLMLRDMIYSKSMNSLVPTLLYVLGFTVSVEIIGAVCVYFAIPDALGMGVEDKIWFAAFHSMSSFCNAGFSCLPDGMANPVLMHSGQSIYLVTSALIFAGAVGFPILVNLKEIMASRLHRLWRWLRGLAREPRRVHVFDLNTKLVLWTTLSILVVSTVAFFCLEYNNSLAGMTLWEKCVQSLFNSLVPRSAGFASVNPATFLDVTMLLIVVQMIIGGSSQSMAGGIKVNTFGVAIASLRAVLLGHHGAQAFNRTISRASVRRANAIVTLSLLTLLAYCVAMLLLEPALPAKAVVFETVSALFTVGSSLGITAELGDVAKVLLCTAMFLGRVGLLSLLCGMMRRRRDLSPHLPSDNVIIN